MLFELFFNLLLLKLSFKLRLYIFLRCDKIFHEKNKKKLYNQFAVLLFKEI